MKKKPKAKKKNAAAVALAKLRKPENMARSPEMARKAALAMWEKRRAREAAV